ncbi:hypothetical protein A5884_000852, partial [Enterococcus sp. 7D2_DIV0200]
TKTTTTMMKIMMTTKTTTMMKKNLVHYSHVKRKNRSLRQLESQNQRKRDHLSMKLSMMMS